MQVAGRRRETHKRGDLAGAGVDFLLFVFSSFGCACALENCPNYRSHRRPSPKSLITEGCAAKRERGPVMNGHCTCPSILYGPSNE